MNLIEKKARCLQMELRAHNVRYYYFNEPSISDYEYDLLLRELEGLESAYPELCSDTSPTQTVGVSTSDIEWFTRMRKE